MAEEIAKEAQEKGEEEAQRAQKIVEEIESNYKELVKDFMKFFEKLSDEAKTALIWLEENEYLEKLISLAQTFGRGSAARLCKVYFAQAEDPDSCDKVVQFIYDNIIGLFEKAQSAENF